MPVARADPGTGHVVWGVSKNSVDSLEAAQGRPFGGVRIYHNIDGSLITDQESAWAANGHTLLVSVAPKSATTGKTVPLADIAAGAYDDWFGQQFAALNALATTPYVIFDHEPNNSLQQQACPAQTPDATCAETFVQAWRHLHDLAANRGYTRLMWTWTMMSYTFRVKYDTVGTWYPGDGYVDAVGADVYPNGCTSNVGTFTNQFSAVMQWHDSFTPSLPVMIPEWGAPGYSADPAVASSDSLADSWFRQVHDAVRQWPAIRGVFYWNQGNPSTKCVYTLDPSRASFRTWTWTALDPWFGGPPATTSTSLAASASSVPAGQRVTLTASVTGPYATPTGTVTFSDGGSVIGSAPLDGSGRASVDSPPLPAGGTRSSPTTPATAPMHPAGPTWPAST